VRPLAQSDGHDLPGSVDEHVPGIAAVIDDIVVGFEDAVREPVVAHILPDVFNGIEFRAFRRQRDNGDIGGNNQSCRQMPSGLIDEKDGVGSGSDGVGDFCQMQVHRLGIAGRQDQASCFAELRADGAEDVGRGGALIARSAWTSAALGPPAGDLVLLANARFIRKPNLYFPNIDRLFARDFIQARWELFLKSSMAPSACA
jgi:hypothetical protein